MVNYVAFAIPVFLISIAGEFAVARARRRALHRFPDVVSNLSAGIIQQVGQVPFAAALFAAYAALWRHRYLELSTATAWIVALVGVDFLFYWWHRLSHEVNLLWAAHVVHHSSEDFNLAVALRQAPTTEVTMFPFFLPLALVGVPPLVYMTTRALHGLYQFGIHTELVGQLGPLEEVLNTPSHHRVHHAINPAYLDKNYGGILMVWDRLFGTFAVENEAPVYGITRPLGSFHVLTTQLHYFWELARDAWRAPQLVDKFKIWLASPAWHPRGHAPAPAPEVRTKFDVPVSHGKMVVIGAILVAAIGATFSLLQFEPALPTVAKLALGGGIFAALLACSLLLARVRASGDP